MWKAIAVSVALCSSVLLLGRMYYKIVRHEFCQVWDTISDIQKEAEATKIKIRLLNTDQIELEEKEK